MKPTHLNPELVSEITQSLFPEFRSGPIQVLSSRADRFVVECRKDQEFLVAKASKNWLKISHEWHADSHFAEIGLTCLPRVALRSAGQWTGYWCVKNAGRSLGDVLASGATTWGPGQVARAIAPLYRTSPKMLGHSLGITGDTQSRLITTRLERWLEEAALLSSDGEGIFDTGNALLDRAREASFDFPLTFLHGDLVPNNILLSDDTLTLVDLEHCGFGHPLFDLAKLSDRLVLNSKEKASLLENALPDLVPENWSMLLDLFSEIHRFGVTIWEYRYREQR